MFPPGGCACGRDLADAADLGVEASHQVIDVPLVTALVTQYDEDAGTVTYGLNIQAWCAFLLVAHHVPVERCAGIIESLTGIRPSDGFVHSILARARRPSGT